MMQTFENDEAGYLKWIAANPNGYVINSPKRPGSFPDMLHRATCSDISTAKRTNYTTTKFLKRCSLDKQELVVWANSNSPDFRACEHCKP